MYGAFYNRFWLIQLVYNGTMYKICAVRREGVGRFTGLPLWRGWGGKKGYLPLILPLASELAFLCKQPKVWAERCGTPGMQILWEGQAPRLPSFSGRTADKSLTFGR